MYYSLTLNANDLVPYANSRRESGEWLLWLDSAHQPPSIALYATADDLDRIARDFATLAAAVRAKDDAHNVRRAEMEASAERVAQRAMSSAAPGKALL